MPETDPDPVKALIRRCAIEATQRFPQLLSNIASIGAGTVQLEDLAKDPELWEAFIRSAQSNISAWIEGNIAAPGEPVPANSDPQLLAYARSLVIRGLDKAALDGYRTGQNVAWQLWMEIVFELASDYALAQRALQVTSRTIQQFVDDTISAVDIAYVAQPEELSFTEQAARREMASAVISGKKVDSARAESKLAYRLGHSHTALIVWSEDPSPQEEQLSRFIERLTLGWGHADTLTIFASTGTRWLWTTADVEVPNERDVPDGIRVVVGSHRTGEDGFRRSHLEALATQRLLTRLGSTRKAAASADTELTNLVTQDMTAAEAFVLERLGELASAPDDVRDTLRTYLRARNSVSQTAVALHAHRNTIVRRIARAEELLPRTLDEDPLGIGVALDVLYWRG